MVQDERPPLMGETTPAPGISPLQMLRNRLTQETSLGFAYGTPPEGQVQKVYYVPAGKTDLYHRMITELFPDTPMVKQFDNFVRDMKVSSADPPAPPGGVDLLVIRASQERLDEIEDFLATVETNIPQVEVEAVIVERRIGDEFQQGVTLNILEKSGDPDTLFESFGGTFNSQAFLDSLLPGNVAGFQGGIFNLGTVEDDFIIDMVIELLAADDRTEIISSPKLLVMSGFSATIKTGEETPIQNVQINNNATVITTTFKETGIALHITPYVVGDDKVRMIVRPEVSAVTGFTDPAVSGGVSNPLISTRHAETSVTVRSGDTLVIGGLDSSAEVEINTRVPVLGSIPFLRYLFSTRRYAKVRTRLLFFIKVRITSSGGSSDAILLPMGDDE